MISRQPDHPIDPLFLERWSPRAFDGSVMPQDDLLTVFEAARWAPSAFNTQPWRWRITGDSLELYADPDRQLASIDPEVAAAKLDLNAVYTNEFVKKANAKLAKGSAGATG